MDPGTFNSSPKRNGVTRLFAHLHIDRRASARPLAHKYHFKTRLVDDRTTYIERTNKNYYKISISFGLKQLCKQVGGDGTEKHILINVLRRGKSNLY